MAVPHQTSMGSADSKARLSTGLTDKRLATAVAGLQLVIKVGGQADVSLLRTEWCRPDKRSTFIIQVFDVVWYLVIRLENRIE